MKNKRDKRTNTIQYRASDIEYERLEALVGHLGNDKTAVLRHLVDTAYNQIIGENND